jgi:hypothetical protein
MCSLVCKKPGQGEGEAYIEKVGMGTRFLRSKALSSLITVVYSYICATMEAKKINGLKKETGRI